MSEPITDSVPSVNRIGIFVDVPNLFFAAKSIYQSKVDFNRLLIGLTGTRQLVRAFAYLTQTPGVNQSGFLGALNRSGYELRIKELKPRTDAEGQSSFAKTSWDVSITIDALTLVPKLDAICLVTGNSDYVPLIQCLKLHGCRTEVTGFPRSTSTELISVADHFIPIPEEWTFKEAKFEKPIGVLASTARGQTKYVGLPVDDDE